MRINTKCLWTLTISILVSILSDNFGQCKSTFIDGENTLFAGDAAEQDLTGERLNSEGTTKLTAEGKRGWDGNFAVWGKRDYDAFSENARENSLSSAQLDPEKRKWSKFASWGKREIPLDSSTGWIDQDIDNKRDLEVMTEPLKIDDSEWPKHSTDKRRWQALNTWGKRTIANSLDEDAKRGWSGFTSWGKRDSEIDQLNNIEKRKWQKFASWGKRDDEQLIGDADKRKWSKFTSWGKRNYEPILAELKKRKWAKFTSWGKRSEINDDLEAEKRKWAKFTSWGKRDNGVDTDEELDTPDKRKWNRLAVWGKRSNDESNLIDKRNWAKFASWGKRPRNPQAWLALNTWGKRRWTGLTTWGKRSGDGFNAETLARKLLHFFDNNGDGALDIDELTSYIRTLMSLPSKLNAEETLSDV
ncbi:uncharacterized protein LOC132758763 [Ruditapes philippinarum]|uniref:uncharacterized protein LOC132758763 n=1 Tax=Ruditapes philippinarum TaxID=129788 RepID=UPI00295B5B37|nr:uncharacterized protein LOC132758763 [Ruditapes philippinarum]XP_060606442.1 uncharacterized protein LOC132758763 [Ruditapes philippinarum]